MKKNKVIEFIAANRSSYNAFDPPYPLKKELPKWYKLQNKYTSGKFEMQKNGNPNHTIKSCMPVFDMMSAGYTIPLPADVYFEENYEISWSTDLLNLVESHQQAQFNEFNIPDGYKKDIVFKFVQPWMIKTPPGYSTMFIHPTYRPDLPFYTLPAIVDTDKHPIIINFPFLIKEGFTGVIEYGTPMVQAIPFKRDGWDSKTSFSEISQEELFQGAKRKLGNRYKTFFRSVKVWN
jgi:hypothetical protein